MSGRTSVKPLLARSLKACDHHLLSAADRGFAGYEEDLEGNLRFILRKYAHLDRKKVSDLLEELDNNRELALQILEAEEAHCNAIIEERRDTAKHPQLSQDQENRILKQSFLSLYKKFLAASTQLEDLQRKYDSEHAENQKLKELNQYLLQGEYSRAHHEGTPPVC